MLWIPKPIGFTAPARPERPLPRQIIIVLPADSGWPVLWRCQCAPCPTGLTLQRTGREPSRATCRRGAERGLVHRRTPHHRLQGGVPTTWARCSPCRHHRGIIHRAHEATTRSLRPRPPLPMPPAPAAVGLGSRRRRRRRSSSSITGAIPGARACGARRGAVRPVQLAARIERPAKATCRWAAPGARHFLGFLSPRVNDSVGRPGILKP